MSSQYRWLGLVARSSCHGLHTFVIIDPVCDLDKGRVDFGIGYLGNGVEDLVGVGCLRWIF